MPDTAQRPDYLDRAEADKMTAEAEKARAEARKAAAEAEKAEMEASKAKIELDREEHRRAKELADDEHFYTYVFDTTVDETSVKKCVKQLAYWERSATEQITVEMHINSPGGGIFEGFVLTDYIAGMHSRGHTVNTTAYGMAASMGGVLLQTGQTRRMGESAALLIHEAQFRAGGKTGAVEDEIALVHMLQDRILDMYADRAKSSAAEKPMTRAAIAKQWNRRDWWISARDCLKHGFIDEIV